MLRKGRFDEIFFVDLPSAEVRDFVFSAFEKARKGRGRIRPFGAGSGQQRVQRSGN